MIESFQDWCLNPKRETLVMGIVNVTPDSFSDGGKFFSPEVAISHASKLITQGADIIDIGGESTRPGAEQVSESEELKRVIPVIEKIRTDNPTILISIDTTKASVAKHAVEAGADIINDVSGLSFDNNMIGIVESFNIPVVIMHMKGNPQNMQLNPKYKDIVNEILDFFKMKIKIAIQSGINRSMIILDPGIGFGKTVEHNFELLSRLNEFNVLELPIMIGPSRKSFIGITLDLPPEDRVEGTAAAVSAGVMNGASIVRVHDVKSMKRVVRIIEKVRNV
ncbi:MAG: dihydropteroate synthase [Candidatus Neomarinimicrobiota bacterium]|nr:MAG: dihydropteroate synthase [Candidatus Neomarinimicrobiota bacterium]